MNALDLLGFVWVLALCFWTCALLVYSMYLVRLAICLRTKEEERRGWEAFERLEARQRAKWN